jgi:hypothetical protein
MTFGGGFIPIIIYGIAAEAATQDDTILTESSLDILTEAGQELLRETL